VLAKLGLAVASINPSATPLWPPTGLALAAVLLRGYRVAPAILIGAFAANATTAGTLATSAAIGLGNMLEGVVGAWLVQRAIQALATRRVRRSIASGDRRAALGIMGASTLGRVWLITIAVLIVGLAEREAGLAAALLSVALFTLYLGSRVFERLLYPEEGEG
jgi:integral membrane sensor domain MASE1